ncbi:hypothetical protein L0Y81_00155 [Burkholderia multivorans]|uniref:hypothetical protein n=1 Tax=Burkholderia multivorans TaxID=87883 RepID=UPI0011B28C00|nr:hypothetical protein [Burkholderia multivorans]MBR8453431.1 hypothetical protein [Burkholderia multivorans]MBU9449859.1 hypothetical protein [Burkholderia multivorans]MCL4643634.1 hypothetical protein [Burkholderia multivorans]UQN85789.1 hypothetical protein L0Y85_00085 [Burkholderia multivorans]UQO70992.1 hypothetical protein L0Y81_00155 [Burkholderia multivorans]
MARAIRVPRQAFDGIAVGNVSNASRKDHLKKSLTEPRNRIDIPHLRACFRDIDRCPDHCIDNVIRADSVLRSCVSFRDFVKFAADTIVRMHGSRMV